MKQERLKKSLEWIERLIFIAEESPKTYARANGKGMYIFALSNAAMRVYRPIRHALNKAIEKPPRVDGNRAFCPDCGGSIRAKDNYCRICGQRLAARQQAEKPFYAVFDKKHYYGR